jgi:hypothetical protein
MAPKTVVLDSNNLEAIIADATGEPSVEGKEGEAATVSDTANQSVAQKTERGAKADSGTGEVGATKAEQAAEELDDIEGEDGLTPRQKRELTEKMLAAIGKKHRMLKDAEEFGAEQYNEKRLAEQRVDQLQREIDRLKAQLQPVQKEPEKPKREDFQTEEAFRDALDDWRVDQKFKAKEAERQQALEAERQAQIVAEAKVRIAKALELVPDFAEVTEAVDTEVPPYIAGYMQESELFAELGYHFAKHPDELARLAKLTPARALVEVGKIESRLQPFSAAADGAATEKETKGNGATPSPKPSTETAVPPPSKPRAAAPIKPLSSGSAVQVEKPESEMSAKEALAAWSQKRHVNLTRRQRH